MSNFRMTRGTTAERTSLTIFEGALVYDTDLDQVYVGDGSTVGGVLLSGGGGGGGISGITVDDEGTPLATAATALNFVGNGVVASGTGTEKTIRIDGGGNVTPPERFLFNVSPRAISEGTGNQTVTVSGIGVSSPFVYTGFTRTEVHGPAGSISTTPESGTGTSFTFDIPRAQVGTYSISFIIESEDAGGTAQPNHTVSSSVRVNAQYYYDQLATAPTALTDLTPRGAYTSPLTINPPNKVAGQMLYLALPTRASGYTFGSGVLFLDGTVVSTIGSHTIYTFPDYNRLAAGTTLNITVTEA